MVEQPNRDKRLLDNVAQLDSDLAEIASLYCVAIFRFLCRGGVRVLFIALICQIASALTLAFTRLRFAAQGAVTPPHEIEPRWYVEELAIGRAFPFVPYTRRVPLYAPPTPTQLADNVLRNMFASLAIMSATVSVAAQLVIVFGMGYDVYRFAYYGHYREAGFLLLLAVTFLGTFRLIQWFMVEPVAELCAEASGG